MKIDIDDLKSRASYLKHNSEIYSSLLELGFELLKIARDEKNMPRVGHMAYNLYVIADAEFYPWLADVYYDMNIYSEIYASYYKNGHKDYVKEAKDGLRTCASSDFINPSVHGGDKELLDEHSLPIITAMMNDPKNSPKLFISLAHKLDELVKYKSLSVFAAAQELIYTLDRPQIYTYKELAKSVQLGYALERPEMLSGGDARKKWKEFIHSIPTL